jgi:hypothetical protein
MKGPTIILKNPTLVTLTWYMTNPKIRISLDKLNKPFTFGGSTSAGAITPIIFSIKTCSQGPKNTYDV